MQKKEKTHMDVTGVIENKISLDDFVENNFTAVDSSYKNPIFPFRVNLVDSNHKTMLCDLPAVGSWGLRHKRQFTFFVLLNNRHDFIDVVTANYGPHNVETQLEIGYNPNVARTYQWKAGNVKIILSKFINVEMVPKYDDCVLAIIGNMAFHAIVHLGD